MNVYSSYSDNDLSLLIQQGDYSAYTEVYDRYWGVLYRYARKIVMDRKEAEDVVQDVFVMLWAKASELAIGSLSSFLYAATRNRILKYFEKSKVRDKYIRSLATFMEKGSYTMDESILLRELSNRIEKEIDALPKKMREIFELRRQESLSYQAISERLSISENTVRKQLNNARKILKLKLGSLFLVLALLTAI